MRKGYHYKRLYHTNLNSPWLLVFLLLFLAIGYFGLTTSFMTILALIIPVCFIILIGGGVLIWYINRIQAMKRKALHIADIDHMEGREFERYIGDLLKFQGYSVSFTPATKDHGADIIARKNGDMTVVQMKRYGYSVDGAAVQQAVAAMAYYYCNKSMVVTNNYFTSGAKELAEANSCTLINRDELTNWILAFQHG